MRTAFLLGAVAALVAGAVALCQTPPRLAFEVTSAKALSPAMVQSRAFEPWKIDKAYARFSRATLLALICHAYRVKASQVSGPDWMNIRFFEVVGKLPAGASTDTVPEMLQSLIEDRFHLKAHRESKEMPVYALVLGKGGSRLTPARDDFTWTSGTSLIPCTLEAYAEALSAGADRPVIDRTGLRGPYMLPLGATAQAQMVRLGPALARDAAAQGAEAMAATLLAQAAEGDLSPLLIGGLKLEPRREVFPMLVIDRVEATPTPN
jgi:uncharacterized protein (TIGR03435 family)